MYIGTDTSGSTTARHRTVVRGRRRWLFSLVALLLVLSLPLAIAAASPEAKPPGTGPKPPGKPQTGAAAKPGPHISGAVVAVPGPSGDACVANSLPANDDGSTDLVPLGFSTNLFGTSYSQLYVNNNGNVTFDQPLSEFTPFTLMGTNHVIVAPFFADVDTRGASLPTTYGAGTYNGRPTFCVDWVNVGYYRVHTDKLNSFQLLLIDRSDTGTGNLDMCFDYSQVQWETGDASDGTNGFGGTPARVGYSNGTTVSFELPGSAVTGSFEDTGTTPLIYQSSNANGLLGRLCYLVRNGTVVPPPPPPPTSNLQFTLLPAPKRLIDTRGLPGSCVARSAPLSPGERFNITTSACGVPVGASAIVGNATVDNSITRSPAGFVTLYPGPSSQPLPPTSTVNYTPGQITSNLYTMGLGGDGTVNAYANTGTHVIIDIIGYYAAPGTGTYFFHPLPAPMRLFDSRGSSACVARNAPLGAGEQVTIPTTSCNIPASAAALSGNATVDNSVTRNPAGFVTLYASNLGSPPGTSNVNYTPGQVVANSFIVALGPGGSFKAAANTGTQLVIDINGYYDTNATGGLLFNQLASPTRLFDSRGLAACVARSTPLGAGEVVNLQTSSCGIPAVALVVTGNGTVDNSVVNLPPGFITIYPGPAGAARPNTSNVNYIPGLTVPNAFTAGLGSDRTFNVYSSTGTHVVIDLVGFFAVTFSP